MSGLFSTFRYDMLPSIEQRLALELVAKPAQVAAAVALLDEGATVPFIARYRKEATGCATCANWKTGAPPSSPRSRNRAR